MDPFLLAIAAAALAFAVFKSWHWYEQRKVPYFTSSSSASPTKTATNTSKATQQTNGVWPDGRPWGVWKPQKYDYPKITPDLAFDLETTEATPYRGFKYEQSKLTMGLRQYDPNEWIVLDNRFTHYFYERLKRFRTIPDSTCLTAPGYEKHCEETVQEIAEFMSRRYPHIYEITREPNNTEGWYGEGKINTIKMPAVGPEADFDLRKDDPLMVAGIQPCDVVCMVEAPETGNYYFRAGFGAAQGSNRIRDKMNMSLEEVHTTGHVPGYKQNMALSMDRYFAKLPAGQGINRNNFSMSMDDNLAWSEKLRGPEEDFDHHTRKPRVGSAAYETWKEPPAVSDPTTMFLRQERQILRRMPKYGSNVFLVRAYVDPLPKLVQEPGLPGRLASVFRSWAVSKEMMFHKSAHVYMDAVLPWLDEHHARQVREGKTVDHPLEDNFPYNAKDPLKPAAGAKGQIRLSDAKGVPKPPDA